MEMINDLPAVNTIRFRPDAGRSPHDLIQSRYAASAIHVVTEIRTWSLLLILFLGAITPARAARIHGRITDATTGEPLAFTTVVIRSVNLGTNADGDGRFAIRNVPVGTYTVEFVLVGYLRDTSRVTVVSANEDVALDAKLTASSVQGVDVVVTARRLRESEASARLTELKSPTVVNVLSSDAIQRTPDVSAAEAVKRIPGISITRMRGEARQAIVRGMEGRYNTTLVDGVKIPSPLENSRSINLDFMPSELLERIEVTKVLTPDMEADAIGGAVNFVMRNAPAEPFVRARLGTGYGSMLAQNDFIGFRTDSILDNPLDRFGQGYKATSSDFPMDNVQLLNSTAPPDAIAELTAGTRLLGDRLGVVVGASMRQIYQYSEVVHNYESIDADNKPYYVHTEWRIHSHSKTKYGFNLKSDYLLDSHNQIAASFVGLFRNNREARILSDTGEVFFPTLTTYERTVFQHHTILSANLNGYHELGDLELKWKGGWSFAQQYKPDRAEVITTNALVGDSVASERYLQTIDRDWSRNTDRDYFVSTDATFDGLKAMGVTATGGLFGRFKHRTNDMNAYRLIPIVDSTTGELPIYHGLDGLQFKVANTGGTPEYANNNYVASEDIIAGYIEGAWNSGRWHLLAGARVEATSSEYSTHDVNLRQVVSASQNYVDVLPSAHLRYALTGSSNVRLSVGRSMSRPNYFDLVPYNYVGEEDRRQGNPSLRRTISTNVDLRYELYPSVDRAWQFSAGLYYKSIQDPIEVALDLSNPSLPTYMPKNFGTATNYGFEVVAGFTFLDHMSFIGNYTFTESSLICDKIQFDRASGQTITVREDRPLQGQSKHVANAALRFDDPDVGTMIQVSGVFTGQRLASISPYPHLNHIQTDYLTLDVSAEQRIWKDLSLFVFATNLLNSPYEIRIESGELIEREVFGEWVQIGFTWRSH